LSRISGHLGQSLGQFDHKLALGGGVHEVNEYSLAFSVGDASALTGIAHQARLHGEVPDEAVIVAIIDSRNKRHAAAWFNLDALGGDQDLKARVIGKSLLEGLERAKQGDDGAE
jgi:hypothetical protein